MKKASPNADFHVELVSAPVRQQVIRAIHDAITSGRFKPGQRLVEKELCELMGVSRPPVREALRSLESEGLVATLPGHGPIVAGLTPEDVSNIYEMRGALEALAAKLFAERGSEAMIEELSQAIDAIEAAIAKGDVDDTVAQKDRFYQILTEGAGNPLVSSTLLKMNARIKMLRRISLSSPERAPHTLKEMRQIHDAIRRRDGAEAFRLSWEHIEAAAKVALKSVQTEAEVKTA